jgi:hypothetical protein
MKGCQVQTGQAPALVQILLIVTLDHGDCHPWQCGHLAQRARHGGDGTHSRSTLVVHLTTPGSSLLGALASLCFLSTAIKRRTSSSPRCLSSIDLTCLLQERARMIEITACAKRNSRNSRDDENSPEFSILTRFHLVTGAPVDMLQHGILQSQSSVFPPLIPDSALIKSNAEGIPGK